jgi:hypothetical protein
MKTLVFTSMLVFIMSGCLIDSGRDLPIPIPLAVDSLQVISNNGNNIIAFSVACTVPDPCWAFVTKNESLTKPNAFVQMIGKRATTDPCPQVLSTIKAAVDVYLPSSGTWTFHFWRSDTSSLDTAIVIP